MDSISLQRIEKLHPKIRESAKQAFAEAEAVLTGRAKPRITCGYRTFAEQQALYDQGRTKPGSIVTNAKPGQSYHAYGLAADFALLIDGKEVSWNTTKDWDNDKQADWMEVVNCFVKQEFSWGGSWKGAFKDMPHLEKTLGYHWRQLLQLHNDGKVDDNGYVLI